MSKQNIELKIPIYGLRVIISTNNIHIENSYIISKRKEMNYIINYLRDYMEIEHPEFICPLDFRSNISFLNEWITHNNLYVLNIHTDRTKDVDLDYPQNWYYKLGYWLGSIVNLS